MDDHFMIEFRSKVPTRHGKQIITTGKTIIYKNYKCTGKFPENTTSGTHQRAKKNKEADPNSTPVLYNTDTRSKHSIPGGIRIFSQNLGHKSEKRDLFPPVRELLRIDGSVDPTGRPNKISTDGSATRNRRENAKAGIYRRMVQRQRPTEHQMSLACVETKTSSNSRAKLGAILEALKQNESDKLEIDSDSLTRLRAICNLSKKYDDLNWTGVHHEDLLNATL